MITIPLIVLIFSVFNTTTITGKVIDELNEPLCGVEINISDGNRLYTDIDGNFTFKTKDANSLIKARYISYEDAYYKLQNKKDTINIVMKSK